MPDAPRTKRIAKIPFVADADVRSSSPVAFDVAARKKVLQEEGGEKEDISQMGTLHLAGVRQKRSRKSLPSRRRKILLVMLIFLSLLPLLALIGATVDAYMMYDHASGGVAHLLKVKNIFMGLKAHPTGFLDTTKLRQAQSEFASAHDDFQQLQTMLGQDALVRIAVGSFPGQVASARALSRIGVDVAEIGQELTKTALLLAPSFRGSILSDTSKPLVTSAMLILVRSTIDYLVPLLDDIQAQARGLSLAALPVSEQQRQQLLVLLQAIPQARSDLVQGRTLLGPVSWMLGVAKPRAFLVQTMDRAELRPTGGFTGQFGELSINGGRVAPFSLKNIGPYEENNPTSPTNGQLAPEPYRSWWPIPNWGLRDSNLSADFSTSAHLAMQAYQDEFGHQMDGAIVFSPFLISRVLRIIGPIQIPQYQETITSLNLEDRLHYYQLDNTGIRKEEIVEHVPDSPASPSQARKLFTARLARVLMDHIRLAPPDELIAIARELLHDLKTKDLQVYASNPLVEGLLERYGMAANLDRSTTHDGLFVVQANLSASKASQYVQTVMQDTVKLDARGGATHLLRLRLVYNQIGPVYGLDTYRDYVRVYVPPSAQLLWGSGFDAGLPFCGAGYGFCPQYDIYQNGSLLCPAGLSDAGYATSLIGDPYYQRDHPIDRIGPPTNVSSDESGRAMFAGWIVVPKNCTMTVALSWYVPPTGHSPYSLLVQRQSSTLPELNLTILPTPGDCRVLHTAGVHFSGIMADQDLTFSVPIANSEQDRSPPNCYPQQPV